jgi:N-acetylmuramate 1-kinase
MPWHALCDKTGQQLADRTALAARFLQRAGWSAAERAFLAGDASDRRYDRLRQNGHTAVLMDAPPGKGDDPATFIAIAAHLESLGLSPPRVLDQDLQNGFLLLEDLGDALFARVIPKDPALERPLYMAATDVLAHVQAHAAPSGLPNLTAAEWAEAACFALDWYRFAITGTRIDATGFRNALTELLATHADGPRVMILRDYHAENLLWLPERHGIARVGLLDFQLAQMGQPGYDLVSLLQDARRDVSPETQTTMIRYFAARNGIAEDVFQPSYAILGAQRALRILGIFARLCLVGAKTGYLGLMPRVWQQLQQNLAHPAMRPLSKLVDALLPAPTPEILDLIGAQCGHYR